MKIGILGGGKVGCCLADYVKAKGSLCGITANSPAHCEQLAEKYQLPVMTNAKLVAEAEVILLTVPDRLVEAVANTIANTCCGAVQGKVFLHVSGSLGLEPLAALAESGASVGSMHPLQSFAANVKTALEGVYMAIDGDTTAQAKAKEIALSLGGNPFYVPAQERAAYHAAACICSNYAVTVEALAQHLMARWTGSEEAAWEALKPLFKGTADNLLRTNNAERVLTGPIGRGDGSTLIKHLAVLPTELVPLYCSLGRETIAVALANGTIDGKIAEQLHAILQQKENPED